MSGCLKPADVFYAFNSDMDAKENGKKGKHKYHFFIIDNKYFLINSEKPALRGASYFPLKKDDCKILKKDCFMNTTCPDCRNNISSFNIENKSELLKEPLKNLIEHIKNHRTLTRTQIKAIIEPLEKALS